MTTIFNNRAILRRFPVMFRLAKAAHWIKEVAWNVERWSLEQMLGKGRVDAIEAEVEAKSPTNPKVVR